MNQQHYSFELERLVPFMLIEQVIYEFPGFSIEFLRHEKAPENEKVVTWTGSDIFQVIYKSRIKIGSREFNLPLLQSIKIVNYSMGSGIVSPILLKSPFNQLPYRLVFMNNLALATQNMNDQELMTKFNELKIAYYAAKQATPAPADQETSI